MVISMKTSRKITAAALAAIMMSSAAMSVYAATEHWNDGSEGATSEWTAWKTEWETVKNDYEKVSITPGADETQLGYAWYSKTVEIPKVRISKNADMSGAVDFSGTQVKINIQRIE